MKIKELKDLKLKNLNDLNRMVSDLKLELLKNQVKIAGAKEKNIKRAKLIKKDIAQILSIIKNI